MNLVNDQIDDNEEEESAPSVADLNIDGSEIFEHDFTFTSEQKVYWTEEQERAVTEYLWLDETWLKNKIKWSTSNTEKETDFLTIDLYNELIEESKLPETRKRKEKIFRDKIEKPINKIIENIIFNYKLFRKDIDVKSLESDALSFLMTKFANFDPSENAKAYSYYGTVAKHYLIGEKKDIYKDQQSHMEYETTKDEVDIKNKYDIHQISHLDESAKLFNFTIKQLEDEIKSVNMSDNDKKVGNAIINIFHNHEDIRIYTKNNLYQMIKEYTGLQTKDITYSLSRFKSLYKLYKQDFIKKNR